MNGEHCRLKKLQRKFWQNQDHARKGSLICCALLLGCNTTYRINEGVRHRSLYVLRQQWRKHRTSRTKASSKTSLWVEISESTRGMCSVMCVYLLLHRGWSQMDFEHESRWFPQALPDLSLLIPDTGETLHAFLQIFSLQSRDLFTRKLFSVHCYVPIKRIWWCTVWGCVIRKHKCSCPSSSRMSLESHFWRCVWKIMDIYRPTLWSWEQEFEVYKYNISSSTENFSMCLYIDGDFD